MSTQFVALVNGSFQMFDSRKELDDYAKSYLTENPDGTIEFVPWANPGTIRRKVTVQIVGLNAGGTGKGRPPGAMRRDPVTGQLLKADGSPAKPMGRPKKDEATGTVENDSSEDNDPQEENSGEVLLTHSEPNSSDDQVSATA